MLRFKRKALACKSEAIYGVDIVPTAAADAFLVRNVELRPLETEVEERIVDTGYHGHLGEILAGQYVGLNYQIELAGAGAAGSIPKYDAIMKAAACSSTNNVGVSHVYAPVHVAGAVSASQYIWLDGVLHKIAGCLADAAIMLPRGRIPYLQIRTLGLFTGPVDQAVPVPTFTGWQKPVAVNLVNTTPFTLHAFAGKFGNLTIEFGNALKYRNLPNSEAIRMLDRKSTGSVTLEGETIATKDWYTIVKNATLGALAVTHGQTAGNKVVISAPNVQLQRPSLGQEDELVMKTMGMILQPSSAANDEWSITVQ